MALFAALRETCPWLSVREGQARTCALALLLVASCTLAATAAQELTGFTVASVKRNTSELPYDQSRDRLDGVALVNERLRDVIAAAYGVYEFQLLDVPAWVSNDRFDISARADRPLSDQEKQVRLQQLLRDRFSLMVRTETREQGVYALTVRSGGLRAGLERRECSAPGAANLACGAGLGSFDGGIYRMGGVPLSRLATFLSVVLGRVVNDETRLAGLFDVDLQWRPDLGMSPDFTEQAKERIAARPALPDALREQLGLELQSRRGPVKMVIVEAISQPTPD
jgi:uncharacterized protein (TIGR03435 family)